MMMITCHRIVYLLLLLLLFLLPTVFCISEQQRLALRDEAREMFIHAYDSYMNYAYPADELMPLSCKGRFRGVELNRGDVDDALGNFSLTLIDTLDTLVILGNYSEFENAVHRVVNDVHFDSDIVVSVFETNIRVLGGLLSGHVLALHVKQSQNYLDWYQNQLLDMAKDIGYRLLPAFNTSTGIPHPRINLKYGLNSPSIGTLRETCTSCAGTMILEFAALSRLSGEPVFEEKARKAMDYLWNQRHRQSNLVGNVINIHTGDWIRKESGVGAGIDSYYEYCLKAYILLGDESYLHRFNRHYAGVMKYVSQGPLLLDVHMHRPHTSAKNFMDSLLAFWPGLQVLKGDLKPAIETHELLYQVTQKHSFLPEAFTPDFTVHWPHHPLRPEFLESTYFLYQATNDEHYLQVGKETLASLQNYTRVQCGFAAVNDVRTKHKEDRMDSFFLAETLKYLFLLFSKKSEIGLNLEEYVFTTEGHFLPLSLSYTNNTSKKSKVKANRKSSYFSPNNDFSCPSAKEFVKDIRLFSDIEYSNYYKLIRRNVRNFASKSTTNSAYSHSRKVPRIRAVDFSLTKPEHIRLINQLGISIIILKDGRVQLVHNNADAQSTEEAEEGASFMQDMMNMFRHQQQEENRLRTVSFTLPSELHSNQVNITLLAGPAQFGMNLNEVNEPVEAPLVSVEPADACHLEAIQNKNELRHKIAMVQRGNCMFIEKSRNVQRLGAIGVVVVDNEENSSSKTMPMFAMSGDGSQDVTIPAVFLYTQDAKILRTAVDEHGSITVKLDALHEEDEVNAADITTDSAAAHQHQHLSSSGILTTTQTTPEHKEECSRQLNKPDKGHFYLSDIFNVLKSNKLKFDFLSSLNLKQIKDENLNLIMSILASANEQGSTGTATTTNKKVTNTGNDIRTRRSRSSTSFEEAYQSLHYANRCANPLTDRKAFFTLLLST